MVAGVVSGAGMAIGELSGYLAGYAGTSIAEARRQQMFERLVGWMQRHGFITIFVLSVVPNPFFDLAGIIAGVLRFPLWRFLLAAFQQASRVSPLLWAGAQWLPWLSSYLN